MHPSRTFLALSIVLLNLPLTHSTPFPFPPSSTSKLNPNPNAHPQSQFRSLDPRANTQPKADPPQPSTVPIGKYTYEVHAKGDLLCRPFGECEVCPDDEMHQPFCRPHGNRRLVHCVHKSESDPDLASSSSSTSNHPVEDSDLLVSPLPIIPGAGPGEAGAGAAEGLNSLGDLVETFDSEEEAINAAEEDVSRGIVGSREAKVKRGGRTWTRWRDRVGRRAGADERGDVVYLIHQGEPNNTTVTNITSSSLKPPLTPRAPASSSSDRTKGELPAWESCGKVIKLEASRYFEFVTTNTLLLILSLVIYLLRVNKIATLQYRQLVARIGIGAGGGGVA